jgi:histidine kinase
MLNDTMHLMRRLFGSLRFKLSFYVGLFVFVAVVAFAVHSIGVQEKNLVNARVQAALKYSEVIKSAIWNGMMTKDREVIGQIIKTIVELEGIKTISIYDQQGFLRYNTEGRFIEAPAERADQQQNPLLKDLESNVSVRHRFVDGRKCLNVVNPIANTPSCSTAACHAHPESHKVLGALDITFPLKGLRTQIYNDARNTCIFAFSLFILISTISGLGVIFFVSWPLNKLQEKAKKMASGAYNPEAALPEGYDSVAMLSRTFDEMSRQINERTEQLEESRRMYKELFEMVPCYVTVIDRDYKIVRANGAFKNEFGDQVGRHCFAGTKGLDSKCENCPVEKTFAAGVSCRSEEIWNPGSKEKKAYVIVHTSPIFDDSGNVVEVMEMSVDVTRMVRLQLELEKKEEEYQRLIENVPCYLTVVDADFRIAYQNNLFSQDFGHNIGEKCFRVYKGLDSKCINCPVERTFQDGANHSSEEVWNREGQEAYIVTYTSPVRDEHGSVTAVMEMCTNVTELTLLQNELAVLGETIAGMSHTVKNILSGLEGGVYMVDSGLKHGKEDRVRLGWEMVRKNVEKVSHLVKDILYASKERQPEYRECDPASILDEVCSLYETKALRHRIDLIRDFKLGAYSCFVDPNGIHNVLSNLIANAVEACRNDARRERHRITVSCSPQNSTLLIKVSDDGTGISEEVKQNLFKKFYSTKGSKGTGLGLVVTRKIVEEHGGAIRVESINGEGTTFFVEIPFKTADNENALLAV